MKENLPEPRESEVFRLVRKICNYISNRVSRVRLERLEMLNIIVPKKFAKLEKNDNDIFYPTKKISLTDSNQIVLIGGHILK